MTKALKPYLARSFGLHACALVAFVFLAPRAMIKKDTVYMIDFVGGPATIAAAAAATPPKQADTAPAPPSQQVDPDSFTKDKRGHVALPRPSLLKGWTEPRESKDKPAEPASAGPSKADAPSSAGSSAGVATDMPNFPYPWYISQVRQMLWMAWQKRMPASSGEAIVAFAVMRNGSFTDLRVESSSGDSAFDKAALESVQGAAPFPALPSDFQESFLKIHLTLKAASSWR